MIFRGRRMNTALTAATNPIITKVRTLHTSTTCAMSLSGAESRRYALTAPVATMIRPSAAVSSRCDRRYSGISRHARSKARSRFGSPKVAMDIELACAIGVRYTSVARQKTPATRTYAATRRAGLRDHVATPAREFPLFPAVVSFLHLLSPEDARTRLQLRAEALQRRLTETEAVLTASREYGVPRLHLLEHEYLETTTSAELAWVRAVSRDLGAGDLTWEPYA
jgi:hypothetical protein